VSKYPDLRRELAIRPWLRADECPRVCRSQRRGAVISTERCSGLARGLTLALVFFCGQSAQRQCEFYDGSGRRAIQPPRRVPRVAARCVPVRSQNMQGTNQGTGVLRLVDTVAKSIVNYGGPPWSRTRHQRIMSHMLHGLKTFKVVQILYPFCAWQAIYSQFYQ
jgi:hypothetical protein